MIRQQIGNGIKLGRIRDLAQTPSGKVNVSGISETRVAPVMAVIAEESKGQSLIVTASYAKAKKLAEDLSFFIDRKIHVIPEDESFFYAYEAKSHSYLEERLSAIIAMCQDPHCIIVVPASEALKRLSPKEEFQKHVMALAVGGELDLEEAKARLFAMGYERMPLVEARGQYSLRGGILDLYPPNSSHPYRIELFDQEIDSIRTFDPLTQRSVENYRELLVYPAQQLIHEEALYQQAKTKIQGLYTKQAAKLTGEARERLEESLNQLVEYLETGRNAQYLTRFLPYFYEEDTRLWDYLAPGSTLILEDPSRVLETLDLLEKETHEDYASLLERGGTIPQEARYLPNHQDLVSAWNRHPSFFLLPFQKDVKGVDRWEAALTLMTRQPPVFHGRMDLLETELKRYLKQGYQVTISCSTEERLTNLKDYLSRIELTGLVHLSLGSLSQGMEFTEDRFVILSDQDIFVTVKQRKTKPARQDSKPVRHFGEIGVGNYVVHENHGIGKYLGTHQLTVGGVKKDYLKIKYAGEDMLYVPVDQMDLIASYVGADNAVPKVNKLSSSDWRKTKARAKAAIQDIAKELIAVSAARKLDHGHAFQPDGSWQTEFEEIFPYEETPDQLRCIQEIKADMERREAMDRLLCGDVGYGKTEVAARAVFKCVAEGKQAAILVPTTILANQHYYTFQERFANYPFAIDMLCRFRNEKQQAEIIKKAKAGTLDILIGTHRMLSKDVAFHDLGLLVIDEEQRFGVQHKEAIKRLRENVDVLTLSATPIPRTLHMSLVGIKEMSTIDEPPEERYPVQTYVLEQDDETMREAIQRELDRGGQVYVVYNRIKGIYKMAARIKELVPEATVAVGHGQMNENTLEDIMIDFMNNKYQILVSTTIIESGIDIPNANTMIILDADRFGLSQLYQLRGRVGRSNRMAYAFLMHQKGKVLTEVAEKRLRAIREFTEFGAGFRLAMRDMEIRGAGNLLGAEQHGHMMMIGYELYVKLVEEAVRVLSGGAPIQEQEETTVELSVDAYLPDSYVEDEITRLAMYKRIASIRTKEDMEEVMDECIDRFGDLPQAARNLIQVALLKALCQAVDISKITEEGQRVVYHFRDAANLTPSLIAALSQAYGMNFTVNVGTKPFLRQSVSKLSRKMEELIGFAELINYDILKKLS